MPIKEALLDKYSENNQGRGLKSKAEANNTTQ